MKATCKIVVSFLWISALLAGCKQVEPHSYLQILTRKAWQLDEIRYVQLNKSYYYQRGGTGNNVNYDDAVVEFRPDGTGYSRWQGNTYDLKWQFDDSTKKITYTLSSGLAVVWDSMTITESQITYTEYYTLNGTESLAHGIRRPQK